MPLNIISLMTVYPISDDEEPKKTTNVECGLASRLMLTKRVKLKSKKSKDGVVVARDAQDGACITSSLIFVFVVFQFFL